MKDQSNVRFESPNHMNTIREDYHHVPEVDDILVERRKLHRIMKHPETCWRCTDRKATRSIGLCDECHKGLREVVPDVSV